MKVLITGANGFIGKNLRLHLSVRKDLDVLCFTSDDHVSDLKGLVDQADFIFHLAGVNRPQHVEEFFDGNTALTQRLCNAIVETGRNIPVVYTSSIQAINDQPYGKSKLHAEEALLELNINHDVDVHIFRLPNVFGKWCKPNYNSVVATFCHRIARDLPIQINDPNASITLVYVDDVIQRFIDFMDGADTNRDADGFEQISPTFTLTVGQLADQIKSFRDCRTTLMTERVGTGLTRALYSTYVSYLPQESFAYPLVKHADPRGVFVEMLRTPDCGQFSYFTAHPGVTRGGHYHHSKTEKFLVIKGQALFKFRHMDSGQTHEISVSGDHPEIVETVPGWTHDITNISQDEMVVMLWANEVFDRSRPDTFACPL